MDILNLLHSRPQPPVHGIDRLVRNVRAGRFERSLSALTAAGALVTAAEIYFEHDSASFGNKMMWVPVALGPIGAAAGVAGFFSRRMAKTALPIASAAIVANGLQGTYLHARGIAQKPGGWSNARYNLEMGPPRARAAAGHHGRRHGPVGGGAAPRALSGQPGATSGGVLSEPRFPGFDVLGQEKHWDPVTAGVVPPAGPAVRPGFFTPAEAGCAGVLLDLLTGQRADTAIPVLAMIDAPAGRRQTDGWRYADMPEDGQAWRDTLACLDEDAAAPVRHHVCRGTGRRPAGR